MIVTQFVDIKIGGKNIKHYKALGYDVKLFDVINVPVKELKRGSHARITVKCDYCGEKIKKYYKSLLSERDKSITKKDCCVKCIYKKNRETNLKLYGVENPMHRKEVRNKLRDTIMNLYGVENISQNLIYAKKIGETQKKFSEYKKKAMLAKMKKTMLERYGETSPLKLEHVRKKRLEQSTKASSQQIKIYEMIKNEFDEIYINHIFSKLSLDIYIVFEKHKIDIEYDSWYWHNPLVDRRRDEYVKSMGLKVLRIKSGHKLPRKNILLKKIYDLCNSDHSYSEIVLNDWNEEGYRKS